jgi:hypothetical protein
VQLRSDETSSPHLINGVSESTSGVHRRLNSSCTTIRRHEQLGDGLVKPNETLTKFAPRMINISAALEENTWYLNLEREIHKNQRARTREGESVAMGQDTSSNPLVSISIGARHRDMGCVQRLGAVGGTRAGLAVRLGRPTCGVGRTHLGSTCLQLFATAL